MFSKHEFYLKQQGAFTKDKDSSWTGSDGSSSAKKKNKWSDAAGYRSYSSSSSTFFSSKSSKTKSSKHYKTYSWRGDSKSNKTYKKTARDSRALEEERYKWSGSNAWPTICTYSPSSSSTDLPSTYPPSTIIPSSIMVSENVSFFFKCVFYDGVSVYFVEIYCSFSYVSCLYIYPVAQPSVPNTTTKKPTVITTSTGATSSTSTGTSSTVVPPTSSSTTTSSTEETTTTTSEYLSFIMRLYICLYSKKDQVGSPHTFSTVHSFLSAPATTSTTTTQTTSDGTTSEFLF